MDEKRIIEINGIKMEIDMRYAKAITNYKVGDNVKVLIKKYGDSFESHPGMIVGFDDFKERPTIVVAYVSTGYRDGGLNFVYINSSSKDVEICPMVDEYLQIEKSTILDVMDRGITKAKQEVSDLEAKRGYFLKNFNRYFKSECHNEGKEEE